jgi:hypothetical protein
VVKVKQYPESIAKEMSLTQAHFSTEKGAFVKSILPFEGNLQVLGRYFPLKHLELITISKTKNK